MINLLPYELRKQLKAARANSSLVKYLIILFFAAIFLTLIFVTYYFILENSRPTPIAASSNTQTTQSADTSQYNQAKVQATKINSDIQTAKNIMDRQISYSTVLSEIAKILPSGSIIDKLDLSSDTLNNLSIKIYSKTADNSNTIKDNIAKSSIFSNYNLKSVKSDTTNPSGYPTTIEITITVNKGALK